VWEADSILHCHRIEIVPRLENPDSHCGRKATAFFAENAKSLANKQLLNNATQVDAFGGERMFDLLNLQIAWTAVVVPAPANLDTLLFFAAVVFVVLVAVPAAINQSLPSRVWKVRIEDRDWTNDAEARTVSMRQSVAFNTYKVTWTLTWTP